MEPKNKNSKNMKKDMKKSSGQACGTKNSSCDSSDKRQSQSQQGCASSFRDSFKR